MYDVIIAGAGPAGASAARELARAGLKVLLFDRDTFPREKPCAGVLSQQIFKWLDFELPQDMIRREFFGGMMSIDGRKVDVQHDYRTGVLVHRRDFDTLLVDKAREAGAEVREGEPVLSCEDKERKVRVKTPKGVYQARWLLVAEGASGRLKHNVRRPDRKNEYTMCVCADIPAAYGAARNGEPLLMHFGVSKIGYAWIFPRGTDASVGMCELGTHTDRLRERMDKVLEEHGVTPPKKYLGHKIPLGGVYRNISRKRTLLIGDAAGFADALLGEGIAYALRSGQLAARAILDGRGKKDCYTRSLYEALCHKELGIEFFHAWLLAQGLKVLPRRILRAALTDPAAISRYIDILADKNSYREFNSWMFRRIPNILLRALRN